MVRATRRHARRAHHRRSQHARRRTCARGSSEMLRGRPRPRRYEQGGLNGGARRASRHRSCVRRHTCAHGSSEMLRGRPRPRRYVHGGPTASSLLANRGPCPSRPPRRRGGRLLRPYASIPSASMSELSFRAHRDRCLLRSCARPVDSFARRPTRRRYADTHVHLHSQPRTSTAASAHHC